MTFGNPDFVKYAEAYGAKGSRAASAAELRPVLEAAPAGGGVHPVVLPVEYSENKRVLVDELRERLPAEQAPSTQSRVSRARSNQRSEWRGIRSRALYGSRTGSAGAGS